VKPECPEEFTTDFGRQLVEYLGGDSAPIENYWCWKHFAKHYPELREKAERYFETATTGNPAYAAYCMAHYCGSDREWAERIIERTTIGDPAEAAYAMVCDCGSDRKWAERIIERAETGDPAEAAFQLVYNAGADPEWAECVSRKFDTTKEQNNA